MKILFEIAFVGTAYHGFQVQPELPTVQGSVQSALEELYGTKLSVSGCSRTDAGVHARQFFVTAEGDIKNAPPPGVIPIVARRYLPDDIAILSAREVADTFHVRYDVEYKEYRYVISNSRVLSPFDAKRAFHYPQALDHTLMTDAARAIVGRQDFAAFMAQGSAITDTVREVKYCYAEREGDYVTIVVAADGFLYNMVRIISGTLVDVCAGRIDKNSVRDIILSKNRALAGQTLPPDGLYLNRVVYKGL